MHGRSSKSVRQKILVPSYQTVSRLSPSGRHQTGNSLFNLVTAKFATTPRIWRYRPRKHQLWEGQALLPVGASLLAKNP
ncbi:hypothetical protein C4K02_4202 [Pseudomonas synxantha]|nr:hypothetical protein C4K02_4202 [Pseudomonas synxantha]